MPSVSLHRTSTINFRMSQAEKAVIKRNATALGMLVSAFLRWRSLDPSVPPEPPELPKQLRDTGTIAWVTPDEHNRIKLNAQAAGLDISEWVRRKGLTL